MQLEKYANMRFEQFLQVSLLSQWVKRKVYA